MNTQGPVAQDEQIFADDVVQWAGHAIAIVVAETRALAEEAAARVRVEYKDLTPILTIQEAIAAESYIGEPKRADDGDVDDAMAAAEHVLEGEMEMGGQEHFYFEPQGCIAVPSGEGEMEVFSSTQQATGSQIMVARALGIPFNHVQCHVKRIGGGFGGKESRACSIAAMSAVAAHNTRRPVRLILPRNVDMAWSGGRNPCYCKYKVGYNAQGRITAVDAQLYLNAGCSMDLSLGVLHKAMLHLDNAYTFPNIRLVGRACKTNRASNTAFRGFGAPQAMMMCEAFVDDVARALQVPDIQVRKANLSRTGDLTYYGQELTDSQDINVFEQVEHIADYGARRAAVDDFNAKNTTRKRGLALVPTRFGVAFGAKFMNQVGGCRDPGFCFACSKFRGCNHSQTSRRKRLAEKIPNPSLSPTTAGFGLRPGASGRFRAACSWWY
jgi:xanthine dehydrogenase/oxidase